MTAKLTDYITLGRSGLRVSPLCLGTMTFGTGRGWGAPEDEARAMFTRFIEAGGNFFDTADAYTDGDSETMLGKFVKDVGNRDHVVISTKYSITTSQTNPNGGGNGRKHLYSALEGSLRRLQTDHIDVYWMHAWDTITPIEEVLGTMNDLVREGKILHYGLSDVPAWYAARLATLAEKEGKERPVALQLEYSLLERNIEREHLPAAAEMGWGLCSWSPLGGGMLTGKYLNDEPKDGRLTITKGNPFLGAMNPRAPEIVKELVEVAGIMGKTPAEVALAWVASRAGVTSVVIGATSLKQLDSNLGALAVSIPPELQERLDEVTAPAVFHPYDFYTMPRSIMLTGGMSIKRSV